MTGPLAPRVVVSPSRAMSMKSALRIYLSVSYVMKSILLTGSLRSPPPIRLRRTSPYAGAEYSPTALFSHSKRRLSLEGVFSIF